MLRIGKLAIALHTRRHRRHAFAYALFFDVVEAHLFFFEHEFDAADWAVSVFADVDVGDSCAVGVFFVIIFAVHHQDDVCVLLDRSGLTKVGKLRDFAWALFDRS